MGDHYWLVEVKSESDSLRSHADGILESEPFSLVSQENKLYLKLTGCFSKSEDKAVEEEAEQLLREFTSLLTIYAFLPVKFEIGNLHFFDKEGVERRRVLRWSEKINMISGDGWQELSHRDGSGASLAARIILFARQHAEVKKLVNIINGDIPGWREIYDLIDAVGGVKRIVAERWAARPVISNIRQTANHYRHLGSRLRTNALPTEPRTLNEARTVVFGIAKTWLTTTINQAN